MIMILLTTFYDISVKPKNDSEKLGRFNERSAGGC